MSYQLELRHLRYFLAVAEDLHFKKASEKLFISQPGLSRQIKQLEEILDVELFDRHNRKVVLTPAGGYLKDELNLVFKHLNDSILHAQLLQKGLEGNLSFGYVGSAIHTIIPALLLKFEHDHPEITYSLKEQDNAEQIDSLLNKEIDMGFVRLERVPETLELLPVIHEPFCLVVPDDYPIDNRNFKDLHQFKDEPFILFDESYSPSYHKEIMAIFQNSGFLPKVNHYTIHASSIFRLIENKMGVSIVPRSLTQGYDMKIKFIELQNIPQRTTLSAVWSRNNRNPVLEGLITLVKNIDFQD